jgi:hypothetical protein
VLKPFKPCRKCYHDRVKNPTDRVPDGFYKDPDHLGNLRECAHHVKWREEADCYRKFCRGGFREDGWDLEYPAGYVGERSRPNLYRVLRFIEVFKSDERVRASTLYLEGPQGCQKTLIASFVGAQLIRAGYDCRFIIMNDLIKKLVDIEWSEDSKEFVEDLQRADLIVYDESFDLDKITLYKSGYQLSFLDTFLRSNLRKRCNVFISNVAPDEIDPKFGLSIRDLITREAQFFDSRLRFEDNWRDGQGKIPERLF